jgi:carbonic anhydrase
MSLNPTDALARLKAGNEGFVAAPSAPTLEHRPFAVVLGCSDARVPPEIIFGQGPGDLFVVRVAGNVAGPTQLASIEFAVAELGARLVVVLGHSECGAVRAALQGAGSTERMPHLGSLTDPIRRAIAPRSGVGEAVRANVRAVVADVRRHLAGEDVVVAGAVYSLEKRAVEFIEDG